MGTELARTSVAMNTAIVRRAHNNVRRCSRVGKICSRNIECRRLSFRCHDIVSAPEPSQPFFRVPEVRHSYFNCRYKNILKSWKIEDLVPSLEGDNSSEAMLDTFVSHGNN